MSLETISSSITQVRIAPGDLPPTVKPEGLGVLSPSVPSPFWANGELMFIPLPEGPGAEPLMGDERKKRGDDDATPDC